MQKGTIARGIVLCEIILEHTLVCNLMGGGIPRSRGMLLLKACKMSRVEGRGDATRLNANIIGFGELVPLAKVTPLLFPFRRCLFLLCSPGGWRS